jgi:hypothetical protein
MRDGGLNVHEIRGAKQPANRAIRAMTAETYSGDIGALRQQSKGDASKTSTNGIPVVTAS